MVDQGLGDDEDALSFWDILGHPSDHVGFMERYPALPQECTTRILREQRLDPSHTRHQHHACQHSGDKCPYSRAGLLRPLSNAVSLASTTRAARAHSTSVWGMRNWRDCQSSTTTSKQTGA